MFASVIEILQALYARIDATCLAHLGNNVGIFQILKARVDSPAISFARPDVVHLLLVALCLNEIVC